MIVLKERPPLQKVEAYDLCSPARILTPRTMQPKNVNVGAANDAELRAARKMLSAEFKAAFAVSVDAAHQYAQSVTDPDLRSKFMVACVRAMFGEWRLPEVVSICEEELEHHYDSALGSILLSTFADLGETEKATQLAQRVLESDPLDSGALRWLRSRAPDLLPPAMYLLNRARDCGRLDGDPLGSAKSLHLIGLSEEALALAMGTIPHQPEPIASDLRILAAEILEAKDDIPTALRVLPTSGKRRQKALFLRARFLHRTGRLWRALATAHIARRELQLRAWDDSTYHILLALGRLNAAFRLYKERRHTEAFRQVFGSKALPPDKRLFDLPRQTNLLLVAEGGPGDEIRVASIYPDIAAHFGKFTVSCEPRLKTLFDRSFPQIDFIPVRRYRPDHNIGDYHGRNRVPDRRIASIINNDLIAYAPDFGATAMTLEVISDVRQSRESFAKQASYLKPDAELAAHWKAEIAKSGNRPNVAIAWSSAIQSPYRNRHYVSLQELAPLAGTGANIWLFQHRPSEDELRQAQSIFGALRPDIDLWDDFEGMAAFLSNMDAVVSPLTTTGELAGGLGVPTILLANCPTVTWRRNDDGSDIWYPRSRLVVGQPVGDRRSLGIAAAKELRRILSR